MKIEIGESLLYSWLRHVKGCQVVQTNWKPSLLWKLQREEELERFIKIADNYFIDKYGYGIDRHNYLPLFLKQAEIDALGISINGNGLDIYAVDISYHEGGLNYGGRQRTVMRVIKRFVRATICLIGYFGTTKGELIFASPKIYKAVINDLEAYTHDLNTLFQENNYNFTARIVANDDFNELMLSTVAASDGSSDTSELFIQGYQLAKMFEENDEEE